MAPPRCSRCPLPAALRRPRTAAPLCRPCFLRAFEAEAARAIIGDVINGGGTQGGTPAPSLPPFPHPGGGPPPTPKPGSSIAVAASGGKDSTVLAHLLSQLNQRQGWGYRLVLVAVDEGIEGYREEALGAVRRGRGDLPLLVLSHRELFGWSVDQLGAKLGRGGSRCTFCGVWRRQALERGARLLGVDWLATGHNADDIAETVLMNFLRGDVARLRRAATEATGVATQPTQVATGTTTSPGKGSKRSMATKNPTGATKNPMGATKDSMETTVKVRVASVATTKPMVATQTTTETTKSSVEATENIMETIETTMVATKDPMETTMEVSVASVATEDPMVATRTSMGTTETTTTTMATKNPMEATINVSVASVATKDPMVATKISMESTKNPTETTMEFPMASGATPKPMVATKSPMNPAATPTLPLASPPLGGHREVPGPSVATPWPPVPRCKPLRHAYEKEIVLYAHFKGLDYFSTECGYSPQAYRGHARNLLKDLEATRASTVAALGHSGRRLAVGAEVATKKLGGCRRCGFATSQGLCKACVLLASLEKGLPRLGLGKRAVEMASQLEGFWGGGYQDGGRGGCCCGAGGHQDGGRGACCCGGGGYQNVRYQDGGHRVGGHQGGGYQDGGHVVSGHGACCHGEGDHRGSGHQDGGHRGCCHGGGDHQDGGHGAGGHQDGGHGTGGHWACCHGDGGPGAGSPVASGWEGGGVEVEVVGGAGGVGRRRVVGVGQVRGALNIWDF